MVYSEKVMDHFMNPRNVGEIPDADGVGTVGNAKCGDIMQMFIKVSDKGIIEDVKFKTFGCGAAIATSSMATELVKGKTIGRRSSLQTLRLRHLRNCSGVKIHCSVLARSNKAAITDYTSRT